MLTSTLYINESEITSAVLTGSESEVEIPRLQLTFKTGQMVTIAEDAATVWGHLLPNLKKLNLVQESQIECLPKQT